MGLDSPPAPGSWKSAQCNESLVGRWEPDVGNEHGEYGWLVCVCVCVFFVCTHTHTEPERTIAPCPDLVQRWSSADRRPRSISEISSCFFGPRPWHIEIRHRVKKTSTIHYFGFETLKLKIRRFKLWKPTAPGCGPERAQPCGFNDPRSRLPPPGDAQTSSEARGRRPLKTWNKNLLGSSARIPRLSRCGLGDWRRARPSPRGRDVDYILYIYIYVYIYICIYIYIYICVLVA